MAGSRLGDMVPGPAIIDEHGEIIAHITGEARDEDGRRAVDWLLGWPFRSCSSSAYEAIFILLHSRGNQSTARATLVLCSLRFGWLGIRLVNRDVEAGLIELLFNIDFACDL